MTRVDAHHHLWDPQLRDYPFLSGNELAPIRRRYDLTDLRSVAERLGVDRTVLVQTVADDDETREFLTVAAQSEGLIAGVVGWTDLTSPGIADALDELRAGPGGALLVGIRHQIQDEPDPAWAARAEVRRGIRAIGVAGLCFDLLVQQPQWDAALDLARSCPETSFVLDHAGKPPIASGELAGWSEWIRKLAREERVLVKLSGLVTEADWKHWRAEDLAPVVETVVDAFGPDRVMIGSDWPVAELAGPVSASWEALRDLVERCAGPGPLGRTAEHFYAL